MVFGLDNHFFKFVLPIVLAQGAIWYYAASSDARGAQTILGFLGLWWCIAALWVEVKLEVAYPGFDYRGIEDSSGAFVERPMDEYRPFCDFARWATCSKVLMSPPGRMLRFFCISKPISEGETGLIAKFRNLIDVPNPGLGVLFFGFHAFYPLMFIVPYVNTYLPWIFFGACCFVCVMTVWLAYNLFFVLKDFCVVCVSMYAANFWITKIVWDICLQEKVTLSDWSNPATGTDTSFFGSANYMFIAPIFVIDAIMFVAMAYVYFFSSHGAQAREAEYLIIDEA